MELAVRKEAGSVPGGGFHWFLFPMPMEQGQADIYRLMGFIVIKVDDEKGERLLKEARAALRHQVEVAVLATEVENEVKT